MADADLTATILRQIRDEIIATRTGLQGELRELRTELKGGFHDLRTELKAELQVTNARLEIVEHTMRDAAGQVVMLTRYIKNKQELAIEELRQRVTRLEAKSGG